VALTRRNIQQGSEAGSINLETSDNTMFCIAQVVSSSALVRSAEGLGDWSGRDLVSLYVMLDSTQCHTFVLVQR
jgi:hypothetical protein